eukprot:CAMPEP_0197675982 /NCGR_PEP_ID=MMETSP1338-20131121/85948_1 /TAXON_ID=43686 ORGANISM="Pelagodinium beii, Strain RCC1491" /NCGR_SAMPLE_ID=MMETSP1338 /ASSEMBLY_ACC=CAM_ASM_000754 /LENGTH=454 /DNA_ID=CAMNT_0043256591 /DNA_START=241 /DNA_END=1605 /DNA_ORIENTATION=-
MAPQLNDACLDVFAPTAPGHGRALRNCSSGEFCSVKYNDQLGFDISELPTRSEGYKKFVMEVAELARQELDWRTQVFGFGVNSVELGVIGLSLGGSMASFAVNSFPGYFTRQLLVNPFFGMGQEDVDQNLADCMKKVASGRASHGECLIGMFEDWSGLKVGKHDGLATWVAREILGHGEVAGVEKPMLAALTTLSDWPPAEHSLSLQDPLRNLLDKQQTWGDVCWKIETQNRGGFCTFKQEHLFAAHAFGIHALVQAEELHATGSFPVTQAVLTERDGITRNGLAYAALRHLYAITGSGQDSSASVSACMYRFKADTDRKDRGTWGPDHVMPHANLAHVDTPGADRWWEGKLFNNSVNFVSGKLDSLADRQLTGSINECVDLPLSQNSIKAERWLQDVIAPQAAPLTAGELMPSFFWRNVILNFDAWAKHVGCPMFEATLSGYVDCKALANAHE